MSAGTTLHPQSSILAAFKKWGSFVRLSHTIFALTFALAAMADAARENRGWPGWKVCGLILAAMVCARTCAMSFNRIVDRKFDALNPRTANRHLPAGQITLFSAILLCALSAAGLIAAAYFLNPICFYLSPVALIVICFYSLTKRFTDYTHVFLRNFSRIGAGWRVALVGQRHKYLHARNNPDADTRRVRGLVAGRFRYHLRAPGLRIRSLSRTAFTRRGVGTEKCLAGGISGPSHQCPGRCSLLGILSFRPRPIAYIVGWFFIVGCLVLEHWIARRRSLNWINIAFFRLNAVVSAVFFAVTVAEVVFQGGFRMR